MCHIKTVEVIKQLLGIVLSFHDVGLGNRTQVVGQAILLALYLNLQKLKIQKIHLVLKTS